MNPFQNSVKYPLIKKKLPELIFLLLCLVFIKFSDLYEDRDRQSESDRWLYWKIKTKILENRIKSPNYTFRQQTMQKTKQKNNSINNSHCETAQLYDLLIIKKTKQNPDLLSFRKSVY